jgi:hypothetical protein
MSVKQKIVPALLVLSIVIWIVWLIVPHGSWIDEEDLSYLAIVRSDLERLVAAQDSLFAIEGHYARSLDRLDIRLGADVSIEITAVTDSGFAAKGTNANAFGECGVFVGTAPAPMRGMVKGEVLCH